MLIMCICAVYLDSKSFTKLVVFDREYTNFADAVMDTIKSIVTIFSQ